MRASCGTSVPPMGVRTEFMVGSVSTGGSQLFVARATLPPGHETPMHLHEIDEEIDRSRAGRGGTVPWSGCTPFGSRGAGDRIS